MSFVSVPSNDALSHLPRNCFPRSLELNETGPIESLQKDAVESETLEKVAPLHEALLVKPPTAGATAVAMVDNFTIDSDSQKSQKKVSAIIDEGKVSLSSSRHFPVTEDTAATADSSPSIQKNSPALLPPSRRDAMVSNMEDISTKEEIASFFTDTIPERQLDIHAITETVLAASVCLADTPSWKEDRMPPREGSNRDNQANEPPFRRKRPRPGCGNCPVRLMTFLKERYRTAPYMIFQLTDFPPDDLTRDLLERQIVHIPWNRPGQLSETPSLATLLHFCYAMSAWLHPTSSSCSSSRSYSHTSAPIAIVSCHNGKTRTALAIACYLKFAGLVENVQSGFCHFLVRRGCCNDTIAPEDVWSDLPASLHVLLRHFDTALKLGGYLNRKPLLLKAIALQGIPVEDRPCLDLWDASGQHVYSSHPHVWSNQNGDMDRSSQWMDEEGFFRVNRIVQGDFCLLCRFGGIYAQDTTDVSKVLFRYANSTAFMGAASPYELRCDLVDLQRRYAHHFEDDDFLVSLLFDAHWNVSDERFREDLMQDCPKDILPDILFGVEARNYGWHLIAQHHIAQPTEQDVHQLTTESLGELDGCPRHILALALQLSNFDFTMAQTILLEGRLRSWWQSQPDDSSSDGEEDVYPDDATILNRMESLSHSEALTKIRELLDDGDLKGRESYSFNFEAPDIPQLKSPIFDEIFYASPIMKPNPGDVLCTLNRARFSVLYRGYHSSFMGDQPMFPVVPHRQKRDTPLPAEDPTNDAVYDFLMRIDHPGVDLSDLLEFQNQCRVVSPEHKESRSSGQGEAAKRSGRRIGIQDDNCVEADLKEQSDSLAQIAGGIYGLQPSLRNASKTSEAAKSTKDDDDALKNDPSLGKYIKMKKMGLPDGAVRNAMQRDGVDMCSLCAILDLDPEKSLKSQRKTESSTTESSDDGVPIKDDPAYEKYFKMKKMGLPDGAVRNSMQRDGVDVSILDMDPEKSLKSQRKTERLDTESSDNDVPIKEDPSYKKYFKMKKMCLPDDAIRNAMQRDGVDVSILDMDPEKSLKSQRHYVSEVIGTPLKEDADWSKYFKMLQMGLPLAAVKNAVERDGKDSSVLDLDPSKPLIAQRKVTDVMTPISLQKKKKPVKRKKIYWNPLHSGQIKSNSLWSHVKGRLQMSQLQYDEKEFADLFTESADPVDKKNGRLENQNKLKAKKSVQVIDGKRSMNGGIILARLKIDYSLIAEMVDKM
jgi:Subunit CCDC53 of WASH complex